MCDEKKLAENVRVYNYSQGMNLGPFGHKCPECGYVHNCEIGNARFYSNEDYDTHDIICSRTGERIRIGTGKRDIASVLVLTNDDGTPMVEYPMFDDKGTYEWYERMGHAEFANQMRRIDCAIAFTEADL